MQYQGISKNLYELFRVSQFFFLITLQRYIGYTEQPNNCI